MGKCEYKNTKTGIVIASECVIVGGDWVKIDSDVKKAIQFEDIDTREETAPENVETKEVIEEPENLDDFNGITVAQIKQELDAFGIEYDPKAKKQELYDLMMQQGK